MKQLALPIHIFVLVTQDDLTAGMVRLLQSADIPVTDSDSIDDIASYLREKTTVLFPASGDDSVIDEIISVALSQQKMVRCCMVSSKYFGAILEEFRKQLQQSARRRSKLWTLSEVERDHIVKTLEETQWQYKAAAKILGIDRSTLYRKLKKYGVIKNSQEP